MTGWSIRDRIAYAVKGTFANALTISGLMPVWRRVIMRERAVVLAYHRLLPDGADTWSHPGIVVTPSTFEQQMRVLQEKFRILSLHEFEQHLATGTPFESGSCLVTFDDGWSDTYTEAWPILRRLGIPAVVFLPTRFIGSTDVFWQERLGLLLSHAGRLVRDEPCLGPRLEALLTSCGLQALFDPALDANRPALVAGVRELKMDESAEPREAIEQLVEFLGPHAPVHDGDRFMSWDQVREMAQGGIAFGVHGHEHHILTSLTLAEVGQEIREAKRIIEEALGVPITSMSYPNGNWNAEIAEQVRAGGFSVAFSMDRGHAAAGDDRFSVRRMNIHEGSTGTTPFFLTRILGLF